MLAMGDRPIVFGHLGVVVVFLIRLILGQILEFQIALMAYINFLNRIECDFGVTDGAGSQQQHGR